MKSGIVTGIGTAGVLEKIVVPTPTIMTLVSVAASLLGAIEAQAMVIIDSGRSKVYACTHDAVAEGQAGVFLGGLGALVVQFSPLDPNKASTTWAVADGGSGASILPSYTAPVGLNAALVAIGASLVPAQSKKSAESIIGAFLDACHDAGYEALVFVNQESSTITAYVLADTSGITEVSAAVAAFGEVEITVTPEAVDSVDSSWFAK